MTQQEYIRNLAEVERLMRFDPHPFTPSGKKLMSLAKEIQMYEKQHFYFKTPTREELKKFREEQLKVND